MFPGNMRSESRRVCLVALLAFGLMSLPVAATAVTNDDCFGCHSEKSMTAAEAGLAEGGPGKVVRDVPKAAALTFNVDKDRFAASVHGPLSCVDCHSDIKTLPHTATLKPVECSGCHSDVSRTYAMSRHVILHPGVNAANPPRCADCHGAHDVLKGSDDNSAVAFRNVSMTCMRCHGATEAARRSGIPIPGAGKMYEQSVHYRKLLAGDTSVPTCVSCHGSHNLKDRLDPESPVFRANITKTCAQCHESGDYLQSIHGTAFLRGVPDAPSCTDCHGDHNIRGKEGNLTLSAIVSRKACPACHGADKMAQKYGVEVEKVKGFQESFHGLSEALGDTRVASCADCHTGHKVYPEEDPRSSINDNNLKATCGRCHPGITDFASQGNIHVGPGGTGSMIKDLVKKMYFFLIIGTIGGMFAHNALDFYRKMKIRYAQRKKIETFERLNASERLQHFLTLSTFITLVITGFALKYNWTVPFFGAKLNSIGRAYLHRGAALVMIYASLYHVYYILTTERGMKQFLQMLPNLQDGKDILDQLQFYFGIKDHGATFPRFSYIEKAEYLALLWGTVVMIVTGFMLWFSTATLKHLPMWALDVATLVHYYEAILATLAIIVWHFYYVFINPDFAPMAFTFIDGNLTREQMEHEHPKELEEIEGKKPGSSHHH